MLPSETFLFTGLEDNIIPHPTHGTIGLRSPSPLPEGISVAQQMYQSLRQHKGEPMITRHVLEPYKDYAYAVTTDTDLATIEQGAIWVPSIVDCFGMVVGSIDQDGKPLLSTMHLPASQRYGMDNLHEVISAHQGASQVSLSAAGMEQDTEILLGQWGIDIRDMPKTQGQFRHLLQDILGPETAIQSVKLRVHTLDNQAHRKGKSKIHYLFADTQDPLHHWVLTHSFRPDDYRINIPQI